MNNRLPTLSDYFDKARREESASPDTASQLLVEYKGKAVRHRQQVLQTSVCGVVLLVTLCCSLFFFDSQYSPFARNDSHNTVSHSMIQGGQPTPPAAYIDGSAGGETLTSPASPRKAVNVLHSDVSEQLYDLATQPLRLRTDIPVFTTEHNDTYVRVASYQNRTLATTEALPVSRLSQNPNGYFAASNHNEMLQYAAVVRTKPQPPALSAGQMVESSLVAPDEQTDDDKTLGLRIGFSYGSMQPEISSINRELSLMSYSPLSESFRQYSIYVAALLGNFSIGAEYNIPASASSELNRDSYYSGQNPSQSPDLPVISYNQNRWSLFASYMFPVLDNLSVEAGAVLSFTAYELSFKKEVAEFPYDPSLSNTDDWSTLWAAAAGNGRIIRVNRGQEAIYSNAVGIGPEVGINWQALSFLALHARLRYIVNFDHNWYNKTSNDNVDGVNSILKMNEYSVQIGASFSQWVL